MTDHGVVERLARVWAATGWPARARGGVLEAGYSAPSAGRPPWDLWVMTPRAAVAAGAARRHAVALRELQAGWPGSSGGVPR